MTITPKHILKIVLIKSLYKSFVIDNGVIQEDIDQNIMVRNCSVRQETMANKFKHLMLYYPDFAFLFFWRINSSNYKWKKYFTHEVQCKIFKSTIVEGGMTCYHPYASVINAKSIGRNFQFRNCLTVGNKNNNNILLPIIGDNVSVGANVVIIGEIIIGNNVIIGAGSVVVKDIPSNCIVAGNPAKIIRGIDHV
ncbi:hypothetical protein MWU76_11485 [Gelidibacter sp. F2691]|nr:hypothetical protein [Gelidibacter sp. F2691]